MDINGSAAIITGGVSGLGEATARALISGGARVALLDMNRELGEKLATELGDAALFFPLNVTDNDEVEAVTAKIKEAFGTYHIVVNCAGIGGSVRIMGKNGLVSQEWFTNIVNVNLTGTFNVIRATTPTLMENAPNDEGERGVYINTASIAAFDGQIGQSAYSASKGGVTSMSLTLAREFARDGIRIMTILPGIFETPLLGKLPEDVRGRLGLQVPFPPRLGRPKEFASLACEIVRNSYLNGEFIRLDGGLRMGFGRK
ncbi:MAG: SDR family NAD(P)-dependent oxidoreductase [Deltaproteobacteria bacterium]|nr:SDR family NAD(P)-dependent oxidoreductase [Deltaproteobacteria bacterium]MBW1817221.1 SDR family NAD(P)-dependent oxidoreductase [Deltaproteobacteria bacterium]